MTRHRESPVKRPGKGGARWVARYTNSEGRRVSAGTFKLKGPCKAEAGDGSCCAQHAIDHAYKRPAGAVTLGAYSKTWTQRHPRAQRTNETNDHRISRVLDVIVDGRKLRDWPYRDLRRRHAVELVDVMLTVQGRSAGGVRNILRALSAMTEDAITDEDCGVNAFKGVRVRASDPRIRKHPARARVWTFEEMRALASAAGRPRELARPKKHARKQPLPQRPGPAEREAAIRVLSDCGLRLGELLGLERRDVRDGMIFVRGTTHNGVFIDGDQPTKKHVRAVPIPPGLAVLLAALPARLDTRVLFATPTGLIWREENWRRTVWTPARVASGMTGATPQSFRHSWVSNLRAAGVDPADLAAMAGHSVATATAVYTHGLGRSYDAVREAVG